MPGRDFKYDVAFSLLARDEAVGMQLNDLLQSRVKTFIYPERQKELAGTDGEVTFGKVFSEEARLVVVLYRPDWGKTKWTRIEEAAIKRRGFDHGYDFAKLIQLEDPPPPVPSWVSPTHIWIGLKTFGLEGAAAVIEQRIKELGGHAHEETVVERAQRTERQIRFDERREKFQWDIGVQAAKQEVEKLKAALEARALDVRSASSAIPLSIVQDWNVVYIIGLGQALGIVWKQPIGNHLKDASLRVTLYNRKPAGPNQIDVFDKPHAVRSLQFSFDLLPTEVSGWISDDVKKRTFSTDALADHLMKFYLEHGRPS